MESIEVLPKNFIKEYLIKQIREIIDEDHPYLAFALIASGIEFLGKCLNTAQLTWDYNNKSGDDIGCAIDELMPHYRHLNLKDELRNGMLHMMKPKSRLSLAYANHSYIGEHLKPHPHNPNQIVLEVISFHNDFRSACEEIIHRIDNGQFNSNDKIFKPFITHES